MKKKVVKYIISILLIIISALIFAFTYHLNKFFDATYFEQLLYNLLNTTTIDLEALKKMYYKVFLLTIIISGIEILPLCIRPKKTIYIKKIKLFPINILKYSISIIILSLIAMSIQIKIPNYIYNKLNKSTLYEKYYVPYKKENITFNEKRNLIYIYVESLENSNFTIENGGIQTTSYTPNLEQLALTHTNFSHTEKIGGFKTLHGTNWTIAGMVAQTAGIPIYIKTKNKQNRFLEGVTSLGEILSENDYINYLLIGSDANFGDRKKYFTEHGNYNIYDYEYAKKINYIPPSYKEWWGYEDSKLFQFAQIQLTETAKKNIPFNFTILTADTHFYEGYTDKSCQKTFKDRYANSFHCEDTMLFNFINWIQQQEFYKNTTIIITGDHLTMRNDFYKTNNNYERTVFNLFINPIKKPIKEKNRDFTAFDIFPTTISSIGGTIKNEKIGLGTNLFSKEKTLSEQIGYQKLYKEIQKNSYYYNKKILK